MRLAPAEEEEEERSSVVVVVVAPRDDGLDAMVPARRKAGASEARRDIILFWRGEVLD